MAAKMFAEVVIAGNYRHLSKSTRGAKDELTGFEKHAKKISGVINAAFAGLAVAGISSIYDGLVDMTKSAAADNKSMAILNKTIDNNWKVTDKTKKKMDDYLNSVSNMTGILDDDLRPAFGKIVRVTKGSTKAMKAFDMVMNISAGTGKDANTVAAAYAKYLTGNSAALNKLVPGLQNASDKAKFLNDQFQGMAAVGGANDPFARINAVMDNFKEKIGKAFLPLVNSFADWLSGPDAQAMMDSVAKWVEDTMGWFNSPEGRQTMEEWYQKAKDLVLQLVKVAESAASFVDFMTGDSGSGPEFLGHPLIPTTNPYLDSPTTSYTPPAPVTAQPPIAINIYGTTSGDDVMKALKRTAAQKGIPLSKLLQ